MYERVKKYRFYVLVLAIVSVTWFWGMRMIQTPKKSSIISPRVALFQTKEDLGKALFFDTRLSSDKTISCASCHIPEKAFTDGKAKSEGVGGRLSFRNAPSLLNMKDAPVFMYDAHIASLEEQAIVPIMDSNEMNMKMSDVLERLRKVPAYSDAAKQLFNRDFDAFVLTRSIAAFERTLISKNSPYDKYTRNQPTELWSEEAAKGFQVFQKLQCIECHQPPHFTNFEARNNGLYADYGEDQGRYRIHGRSEDKGAFKVPSLRNVALTAPYMHDGSIMRLEQVIDHYISGGKEHVNKDDFIKKRSISEKERKYLLSFLNALTDTSFLADYR